MIGAALFWMPFFVFKVAVFFTLLGIFFWFGRGFRSRYRRQPSWHYSDKIRSMSDEEYDSFKSRFGNRRCGDHSNDDNQSKSEDHEEKK